jgi:hypothetical protein
MRNVHGAEKQRSKTCNLDVTGVESRTAQYSYPFRLWICETCNLHTVSSADKERKSRLRLFRQFEKITILFSRLSTPSSRMTKLLLPHLSTSRYRKFCSISIVSSYLIDIGINAGNGKTWPLFLKEISIHLRTAKQICSQDRCFKAFEIT